MFVTGEQARSTDLSRFWRRIVLICFIAATGSACRTDAAITADTATARVLALMECIECNRGERVAVLALGQLARPALDSALSGPHAHRLAVVDSSLRFAIPPVPAHVIQLQLKAYKRMYTRRASNAIGIIGGPRALALLCRARTDTSLRASDSASINQAILQQGGTCP